MTLTYECTSIYGVPGMYCGIVFLASRLSLDSCLFLRRLTLTDRLLSDWMM